MSSSRFFRLLRVLAGAGPNDLRRQIQYLKAENEVLRSKIPGPVRVTAQESSRLARLTTSGRRAAESKGSCWDTNGSFAGQQRPAIEHLTRRRMGSRNRHHLVFRRGRRVARQQVCDNPMPTTDNRTVNTEQPRPARHQGPDDQYSINATSHAINRDPLPVSPDRAHQQSTS
jgi:hypothetical protein